MNPKIAELAEQATQDMQFSGEGGMLQTTDGETTYDIPAEFIELFAELIVRECMSLVSEPGEDMNDTERGILAQFKQHFGVRE